MFMKLVGILVAALALCITKVTFGCGPMAPCGVGGGAPAVVGARISISVTQTQTTVPTPPVMPPPMPMNHGYYGGYAGGYVAGGGYVHFGGRPMIRRCGHRGCGQKMARCGHGFCKKKKRCHVGSRCGKRGRGFMMKAKFRSHGRHGSFSAKVKVRGRMF